ncbi:STAS domain-containing protein [Streptomyces sp. NPDC056069]|uniref:STAS domain-containing protein n=1 Tax=Streptomyces sp. NPDC056069 TaxID=3345702 RepID=UPI0035DF7E20
MSPLSIPHPAPTPARAVAPQPIRVRTTQLPGETVVGVEGTVCLDHADGLRTALMRTLASREDGASPVGDTSATAVCDATGPNILLRLRRQAEAEHRTVAITGVRGQFAHVPDTTRTRSLFGFPPQVGR